MRIAATDTVLGDREIAAGDIIFAFIASANRDPDVFSEPDRFLIERERKPHIAFGHGPHFCVGAGLARLEAISALSALFSEFPGIRLAPGWEPVWTRYPQSRLLDTLRVELA